MQEMHRVQSELQPISGWLAGDLGDVVDRANHITELATSEAMRCVCQQKLGRLEQAWARFCAGQYGICESCCQKIDPARLEVIPYATCSKQPTSKLSAPRLTWMSTKRSRPRS